MARLPRGLGWALGLCLVMGGAPLLGQGGLRDPGSDARDLFSLSANEAHTWYCHPEDLFRISVPRNWTVLKGYRGITQDHEYDSIVDAERRHTVICWRGSDPAEDAIAALETWDQEKRRELGNREGLSSAGFSIDGIPMLRMTYPIADGKIVSRTAIVTRGRRVTINTVSPAGVAPDRLPAVFEYLLGNIVFPASGAPGVGSAETTADAPKVPPGWVTRTIQNVTVSMPPEWTAVEGTREGQAMWRLGEGDSPRASLALVRNQPWERFSGRIQSPEHRTAEIAGMEADVYEGLLAGSETPARLRIIVLHPSHPLADTLTWVCYAMEETWPEFARDVDVVFATLVAAGNGPGRSHQRLPDQE